MVPCCWRSEGAERPGSVERRQDRAPEAVLQRDGLHVRRGVDHTERDAVQRERGRERHEHRCQRDDRHGHRDQATGRPGAPRRCRCAWPPSRRPASPRPRAAPSSAAGPTSRPTRATTSPARRQPGGEADEDQSLREEAGRGGGTGMPQGRCHLGSLRRHGETLDPDPSPRPRLATCRTRTRPTTPRRAVAGAARRDRVEPRAASTPRRTELAADRGGGRVAGTLRDRLAGVAFDLVLTSPPPARASYRRAGRVPRRRGRRGPGGVGLRRLRGITTAGDPRDRARLDGLDAPQPGRRDAPAGLRPPRPRRRQGPGAG